MKNNQSGYIKKIIDFFVLFIFYFIYLFMYFRNKILNSPYVKNVVRYSLDSPG